MSSKGLQAPGDVRWRVGHASDPIGFLPRERCSWNHRFDDPEQRFRTLYCEAVWAFTFRLAAHQAAGFDQWAKLLGAQTVR